MWESFLQLLPPLVLLQLCLKDFQIRVSKRVLNVRISVIIDGQVKNRCTDIYNIAISFCPKCANAHKSNFEACLLCSLFFIIIKQLFKKQWGFYRPGVCLSACWDTTPQEQVPLGAGIPSTRHHPWEQTSPLRSACWEKRSTSGRYASYWNAILFPNEFH